MNRIKAQFSLKDERGSWLHSPVDNEWICRELILLCTLLLYFIGIAQSEKEISENHKLRFFLSKNAMIRNQCFSNLICGASFSIRHCM